MLSRRSHEFFRVWVAAILCLGLVQTFGAQKPLLVHYMPWFVAKPYSTSWGWHWTMNHYNPDTTDASGRRQIASWYYPQIGPYDSLDPVVLEYHVLLMKLGGVDGVIVDWYGNDNYLDYGANNQRTAALLTYIRKAGLTFSLCYEDSTIGTEVNGSYIYSSNAIAHAQQTMLYAQSNYFNDACYLRLSNQPVLLNFGPRYFTSGTSWQTIFSVLNATNQPAFFTEDNRITPAGMGAFDWPPMSLSQTNGGVLTTNAVESYLNAFETKAGGWPAYVSSGFPRFHDIYSQAGVSASYGYLDDANGSILTNTVQRAMTNGSALIQVTTWNDFGEGTIVEPTLDYGCRDLGIIQSLRHEYVDPAFSYTTNDLSVAYRLYQMRRQNSGNIYLSAELNRVFTNAVYGSLATAKLQLTGMESNRFVIYDCSIVTNQLRFTVGGYVASGLKVLTSSNLTASVWRNVGTYAASTGKIVFSTPMVPGPTSSFYKIQGM
jgi:hypothetical protein